MRSILAFLLLVAIKYVSKCLWRVRLEWLPGSDRSWEEIRVVAILNHTSLFEPIFVAAVPVEFLREVATHGVVPVADVTTSRPLVGKLFRNLTPNVVSVTRERDESWDDFMSRVDTPGSITAMLPEGRMMRATGLDSRGNPMTVRGGLSDILQRIPAGRILLLYSSGLHHVHTPGDWSPRFFRPVRGKIETLDIPSWRDSLLNPLDPEGFKVAVIEDLTRRRDRWCYTEVAYGKGWTPRPPSEPNRPLS